MDDTNLKIDETQNTDDNVATQDASVKDVPVRRRVNFGERAAADKGARRERRSGGGRRPQSDMDQRTLAVRRVARVVAGGRRFSFSVLVVVGDRKGRVGVGLGKGGDTALAIDKAVKNAKKGSIKVNLNKTSSISRATEAKYASARVLLQPAPGRGMVAGSAVRTVLELAGVKDVNAKIVSRSKNKLNIARAAILALKQVSR